MIPRLGDKIKDKFSGLSGVAFAHTRYLVGSDSIGLLPNGIDASGKAQEVQWFNADRIEVVENSGSNFGFETK